MIDFKELPDDGIKFEQLIRELLRRSDFDVHWTGVGPDGGRDLIIKETAKGRLSTFQRKWLVSCKHKATSNKSVGIGDISNLVDDCEAVSADGFLLACSTQPSSAVVKRLEEIEVKGKIKTHFWDAVEIEKRLNTPQGYPLIHLFFPDSSKSFGWSIYGTRSPSLWAANYKDYFIYLSSRCATTFPDLKNIEEIIRRLEEISLPEGSDWEAHYLRPRAVYFDNKHEQFSVFADYIYPRGTKAEELVQPSSFDSELKDGQGLYSDGHAMWYLTNWDIRYVEALQMSDHFHLDHKDYYEPYIDEYSCGFARQNFISEMPEVIPSIKTKTINLPFTIDVSD